MRKDKEHYNTLQELETERDSVHDAKNTISELIKQITEYKAAFEEEKADLEAELVEKDEELEKEKNDILIGAFEEDKMLGCCLLTRVDDNCVRLRQMAVPNSLQGKGIGASMMNFAEHVARDAGYKKLINVVKLFTNS